MANASRNSELASGISRYSRSKVYSRRALWKRNKAAVGKAVSQPAPLTKTVAVKGEKNGSERTIALNKAPRYYPAHDLSRPLHSHNIKPGTVLILLAGRFRGKRVVFLKQLSSGLLLVTGPYRVNGVPLRRVNQAYVIATSTSVDLSDVKVDEKFNDDYFKREKAAKNKKATEEEFFGDNAKKPVLAEGRAADQKSVDAAIIAAIDKVPMLRSYIGAKFSLSKGQAPHAMKF
ncbi:ribosomal protein L6e-domain-containing protein [Syncephalis plumigaleata]|nr:ribosomal protein L6e-domain-containing protein [Syncephalis plumigaleata]